MEDDKLAYLEQLKIKLHKEISNLQSAIQNQKNVGDSILRKGTQNLSSKYTVEYKTILCESSYHITGITFNNVNKHWVENKIYKYTANVGAKAIYFYIELTIDLQDDDTFEILDITCHFVDIKQCFMLEITPWIQLLAKKRNFSLFMTAISDYNEYNILRKNTLDKLRAKNYISYRDCEEGNGGILIDVNSSQNNEQTYLKFQWSMKFFEETCHIEHHFTIAATDLGMEFMEINTLLLKKFCKLNLNEDNLTELWSDLCFAIDNYEDRIL